MRYFSCLIAVAAFFLFSSCSGRGDFSVPETVSVTAHRGGAKLGNENTLSCIRQGMATGADMIEVDVHLTRDGEVVVCHDETIDRTTNGTGRIEDLSFAELRAARIVDACGMREKTVFQSFNDIVLDGSSRLIPFVDGIITNDPALFMSRRPANSQI